MIIYSAEFHFYINKNVLTKEQIENGWTSTGRGELGWSFYILFISVFLKNMFTLESANIFL